MSEGVLPQIQTVGESNFWKMLIYGVPGVGKTTLIGTGGPNTLILRPPTDHTDSIISAIKDPAKRPKEMVMHNWDEAAEVLGYLRHEGNKWDSVWLDSISLWQDIGLDDIWEATKIAKPERDVKYAGKDRGEYGRNMDRLGEWIRHIVGSDSFNFGVTAHPAMLDIFGSRIMGPWVQGKQMAEKVCGYMNIVGYMEVKKHPDKDENFRQISFDLTPHYYAKDQFQAFERSKMFHPTLPKLDAAIRATRGPATTAPATTPTKRRRKAA